MDFYLININKMITLLLCLAFAAHVIRGANQCVRTNSDPSRYCADQCTEQIGCRDSRKKCLCDGDCGYSCIYPTNRCQDPGTPWKGSKRGNLQVGQALQFSCDQCYKLRGNSTRTCQADLTWSGRQPRCTLKRCIRIEDLTNRKITVESNYCGRTAVFECDPGYQLRGARTTTCQNDGTWSAKSPTCVGLSVTTSCSQPVLPPGSRILVRAGNMLAIGCKKSYKLLRTGLMQCNGSSWKIFSRVSCSGAKSCQDPGTPRRGDKKGNLHVGQTLQFSCDQCYQLRGNPRRTCRADLTWSGSQPRCTIVRCTSLQHPRNGRITAYSTRCRSRAVFRCNSGFQLKGSKIITCQNDGIWSVATPICVPVKTVATTPKVHTTTRSLTTATIAINSPCGRPALPPIARVRLNRGNRLFLVCKENYSTSKLGLMHCVGNKWRILKSISCLAKACPDPGVPVNGYRHGASYFIGDVVKFTCDDCYRLNGSSERTCLKNRTWSGSRPKCVLKTCPPLKDTKKSTVSQISRECKAVATYTCIDKTLTMLGSGEKICNTSGLWEGAEPECINPNLNIALRKPVAMSSYSTKWSQGPSDILVDGIRYGNGRNQLLHTENEYRPWMMIDLQREEPVSTVIVVNRVDCCVQRINGFRVSVGNNGKEPTKNVECGGRSRAVGGPNIIQCPKTLRGRYVFVYLPRASYRRHITLYEIEVYRLKMTE